MILKLKQRLIKNKKTSAQSMLEYALLICIVVGAFWGARIYIIRALGGYWRNTADTFGFSKQFCEGDQCGWGTNQTYKVCGGLSGTKCVTMYGAGTSTCSSDNDCGGGAPPTTPPPTTTPPTVTITCSSPCHDTAGEPGAPGGGVLYSIWGISCPSVPPGSTYTSNFNCSPSNCRVNGWGTYIAYPPACPTGGEYWTVICQPPISYYSHPSCTVTVPRGG